MSAGVVTYADAQRRHPGGGGGGGGSQGGGGGGGGAVPRGSAPPPSSAGRGDDGGGQGDRSGGARARGDGDRGDRGGRGGAYRGGSVGSRGYGRTPWRGGGDYNFYRIHRNGWYYNPWGWGTFGFGYIWDPFWWGYPYGGGYGYGYPYGGGYYGGGYGYRDDDEGKGGVRLKVQPKEAEVLVDGYYYGTVNDFDGAFQSLKLEKGPHEVTLRLNGFEALNFKIFIVEHETITYKGRMQGK
jgi:hypothetical protein